MIDFTLSELAGIIKAKKINVSDEIRIKGISTDSRTIQSGCAFIALPGEKFDGHDFIPAASSNASCIIAQRETDTSCPQLIVEDTYGALAMIGRAAKERLKKSFDLKCTIGVTGSVGKTTTKEFVSCALQHKYETFCTPGNLNNHIGLPLTLCAVPDDTKYLVCEMGMSGKGEISHLASISHPDIAIITNIGVSHIENLGSREAIRDAKLEMVSHMKEGSLVILNGDEPLLRDERACELLSGMRVIYAGFDTNNDIYPTDILSAGGKVSFDVISKKRDDRIVLPVIGDHFVLNALFAYAVAIECGVSPELIAKGLAEYKPTGLRQKIYTKNGITVIADCYNAGPESMEAALKVLGGFESRRIAVLSDMLELGMMTREAHITVGKKAALFNADELFMYGKNSGYIAEGAISGGMKEEKIHKYEDKESLSKALSAFLSSGDTVLFKASRRMRLEDVIESAGLNDSDM